MKYYTKQQTTLILKNVIFCTKQNIYFIILKHFSHFLFLSPFKCQMWRVWRNCSKSWALPIICPLHLGQCCIRWLHLPQTKCPWVHWKILSFLVNFSKQTGHSGAVTPLMLNESCMNVSLSIVGTFIRILNISLFLFFHVYIIGVSPFPFLTFQSTLDSLLSNSKHWRELPSLPSTHGCIFLKIREPGGGWKVKDKS